MKNHYLYIVQINILSELKRLKKLKTVKSIVNKKKNIYEIGCLGKYLKSSKNCQILSVKEIKRKVKHNNVNKHPILKKIGNIMSSIAISMLF
jgi:hypothetical protein